MTGQEPSIKLVGRKYISSILIALANVYTFGIFYMLSRMSVWFQIRFKTSSSSLEDADCIVLEDQYGFRQLVSVIRKKVKPTLALRRYTKDRTCRVLDTCYGRFIYDFQLDRFVLSSHIPSHTSKNFDRIYQDQVLKSREEERMECYERSIIYGKNDTHVYIPTVLEIFLRNIIEPFFMWELLSLALWISIGFYSYASVVGLIYLGALMANLRSDLRNRNNLAKNRHVSAVRVLREGAFRAVPDHEVFPGDIIYIGSSDSFVCDAEILKGDVIVDESFLTGESIPICKGSGSTVFSGTRIIKSTLASVPTSSMQMKKLVKVKNLTRKQPSVPLEQFSTTNRLDDVAIGVVVRTGKRTKRGTMLRSLAMKKPADSRFRRESIEIIKWLIAGALSLMAGFTVYFSRSLPILKNIEYTSDLAMTFFNPSLYTCLQLGARYSRGQLLGKRVSTSDMTRINTAGEVDLVIFDKTGTLTELGVDVLCFDTIRNSVDSVAEVDVAAIMALSTCHHVLELDNQYSGDILDIKMFMFSQSKIINRDGKRLVVMKTESRYEAVCKEYGREDDCTLFLTMENGSCSGNARDVLEVVKIHDFDLYLRRLSVVVRNHEGKMFVFCKGAPDSVCNTLESIPGGYFERMKDYGLQGHRVLAVAYKEITGSSRTRGEDENGLDFLGFLVFANKLKEEAASVIEELKQAALSPKMCTGDNILTAISVARECGIIAGSTPVLFPVLEDGCKSYYDVDWFCVAEEDYIFDKLKMCLYSVFDRETTYDFVVAVEGKEFEYFKPSNYHSFILEKGVVFARFNPDNKKDLIEEYSITGRVTMFCGDGANDMGALCSADVGVSLATNEASLAASFNSQSLCSVLDIMKEGRSALSMSASQFKYIFYSQVLSGMQIASLLPYYLFPSSTMSLVSDIMGCYILGYALTNFKAAPKLSIQHFNAGMYADIISITLEVFCVTLLYPLFFAFISEDLDTRCVSFCSKKSTTIFFSTCSLLIVRAFRLADFGPHRESRCRNRRFLLCLLGCLATLLACLFGYFSGNSWAHSTFNFASLSPDENVVLVACLITSILVSLVPYRAIVRSLGKSR